MENETRNQWFELSDILVDFSAAERYNKEKALKNLVHLERINLRDNYYWSFAYIKISANLKFFGKLSTPRGEEEVEYTYFIKTNLEDLLKEAKITIYEQSFTGLSEAVTIRFSSGSIISKIVFGDIEEAFKQLKKAVLEAVTKYNGELEEFNKNIDKLKEEKENKETDED